MPSLLRKVLRIVATVGVLASTCAHAPPVTGNRDPNAPIDPDNPEQNCQLNNTVDCRPASD